MPHEMVSWLYDLQRLGVKLGLDGIRELLTRIGHPDRAYPCWLVGGTNGKGSVSAMLDALLASHGVATGLYTSPHLMRPHERIRVRGADVADGELADLLRVLRTVCESGVKDGGFAAHPSFFEVMTAAALEEFRRAKIEAAVLEVGLGGRLDATNATDPALSIVVTVDHDHAAQLGATLPAIATEKAAIARPGRPLVSGVVPGPARDVLLRHAGTIGAHFVDATDAARIEDEGDGRFTIITRRERYPRLSLPLLGEHQRDNARVALVALEEGAGSLGLTLGRDATARGFAAVRWPGRLQWLPGTPPCLLDGAHNAAGADALARFLDRRGGPKPVLLFAAMRDKDLAQVLGPLAARASAVVCTRPDVSRAVAAEDLAALAARWNTRSQACADAASGFGLARSLAIDDGPEGFVLVAGSLYLVGEVLAIVEGNKAPGPVAM